MRTTAPRGRFQRGDLPSLTAAVDDWRHDAACRGSDPELWFAAGENWHPADVALARSICARCPSAADCLTDALDHHDRHAIRAGLLPQERSNYVRRARRNPTGAA